LKYEDIYLHAYASVPEAKAGIEDWLNFYNAVSYCPTWLCH
jgi:putative transposase